MNTGLTKTMALARARQARVNAIRQGLGGIMSGSLPTHEKQGVASDLKRSDALQGPIHYVGNNFENKISADKPSLKLIHFDPLIPADYRSKELRDAGSRAPSIADDGRNLQLNPWCMDHYKGDLEVITAKEKDDLRGRWYASRDDGTLDDH